MKRTIILVSLFIILLGTLKGCTRRIEAGKEDFEHKYLRGKYRIDKEE